jgi:4-amino-4-deoxy-L-arabinose transferase
LHLKTIIDTNFTSQELSWIICAIAFGAFSIILFLRDKYTWSILSLFISGLILRFVMAGLDPFLWTWDEQYHALVAKNMMTAPFKPMLVVRPYLDYDFTNWQANHIWLHKQPFFLWQIALFFKLFGVNEFVLRWPTAIMMSLMILLIYRIGKLLSNPSIAWDGAFLYTFSFLFLELTSGCICTDHNDAAFLFYITMSIWAWVEYTSSGRKYWLVLIGLFSGIAVLTKWVVGLLVYSGWWMSIIVNRPKTEWLKEFSRSGIALATTLLIAVPWQLFILHAYPVESRYELLFNGRHFFENMEDHGGPFTYYLYLISEQYGGILATLTILPGLWLLFKATRKKVYVTGMITFVLCVYLFFSFAATKMALFCVVVSPVIFLGLGGMIDFSTQRIKAMLPSWASTILIVAILGYLAWETMRINRIDELHSNKNIFWRELRKDAIINRTVARMLPSSDWLVFNTGGNNAIMFMFYNQAGAYGCYPNYDQYRMLKSQGVKMATVADQYIPDYLRNDPQIRKIYVKPTAY